jgi:hypothetical protein
MSPDIFRNPCCSGERQDIVARQRREMNIGRRQRIDPDRFVDLLIRGDLAGHIDAIETGVHEKPRLVRRNRVELAKRPDRGAIPQPSSSAISRESAAMSSSPALRLPPGCMKVRVPRLRTSSARPVLSEINAATIWMVAVSITRLRCRCRTDRIARHRAWARRGRDGGRHAESTAARAGCAEDSRTGSGRAR